MAERGTVETRNPVLRRWQHPDGTGFAAVDVAATDATATRRHPVTMPDVLAKSAALGAICAICAYAGWLTADTYPWLFLAAAAATLALGLINSFKTRISIPLIVAYSAAAGLLLGTASNLYNTLAVAADYPGLVSQAVIATGVTFAVQLTVYTTGIVKVTGKFVRFMTVALLSYLALAGASFIAALAGGGWGFYGVGVFGLAIAAIGVLLAAFTLLLDFEAVQQAIAGQADESESWRPAFGLLVTLVWLYLEILRLLTLIAAGRD